MNDPGFSPLSSHSFRRDKIYWLFTVLALVFAGGYGFYWHHNPEVIPPPSAEANSNNPRILVLAFDKVVKEKRQGFVDSATLRAYLNALSASGFEPITVQDLHNFYYSKAKLPSKPILLTFDFGHLDTYLASHAILVETGWRAAMSITTGKQLNQNTQYLYWDRLQRMINSGYWEVLTHGHQSDELIQVNQNGDTAPFVSSTKWIIEQNRTENTHEFSSRIAADIMTSSSIIKEKLDADTLGYVFRYGKPEHVYKNTDILKIERQLRSNVTPLAFADDDFGVNDRHSNPHNLRRLRISPDWGPFELMSRIHIALTFPENGHTLLPRSRHWINVEGEASILDDHLALQGTPRSLTWLAGSQWQDNWIFSAKIQLQEGDFWLIQGNGEGLEWRFGGNQQGLYLKTVDHNETINLLRKSNEPVNDSWHSVQIVRRGTGIWISWDGQPIWSKAIRLPDNIRGPIGFLTWSESGNSRIRIEEPVIASIDYRTQAIASFPSAEDIQQITKMQQSLSALSPRQFTLNNSQLNEHKLDSDLFKLLKHRYAWQIVPTIEFGENPGNDQSIENIFTSILTRANAENWGGIHLDLRALDRTKQKKLDKLIARFDEKFHQQQRNLLISQVSGQPPQAFHSYSNNLYATAEN